MTVYYSIAFLILVAEMVTFCVLVLPLPYTFRKRLFQFLSESPLVAKLAYGVKIAFISIGILFVDAVQRMMRITAEVEAAKSGERAALHNVQVETNLAARKFYAQRNTYLTGFTLFLSLVLTRTFYIVLDLIHAQEEYAKLKAQVGDKAGSDSQKTITDLQAKVKLLEAKDRDFETLKKQSKQQQAEYDRLATQLNQATGQVSNKRFD